MKLKFILQPEKQAFCWFYLINNLKYEIARELGIKLGADTSSRLNGTVGGEMTKRLVKLGEQYLNNNNK